MLLLVAPFLASSDIVPPAAQTLLLRTMVSPQQEGSVVPTRGSGLASQPSPPPLICLAPDRPELLLSSCAEPVRRTILNARAPSTRLQYANRWKLFVEWCENHREDPVLCSVSTVLEFLQSLLDTGWSPSTLKGVCGCNISPTC